MDLFQNTNQVIDNPIIVEFLRITHDTIENKMQLLAYCIKSELIPVLVEYSISNVVLLNYSIMLDTLTKY